MNLVSFRRQVLTALQAARSRWPEARMYLLYAPGFDDPLGLAQSGDPPARETALIPWSGAAGYDESQYPRLIEFDGRRVARYLIESDAAFDDPLLEDTITQAHRDLSAAAPEPDGDEGTGRSLCGWLVSRDSADAIADRFERASHRFDPTDGRRHWLRWHDPRLMALLWPGLTDAQKTALLGEQLTWLASDAAGHLVEFSSAVVATGGAGPKVDGFLTMTEPQWGAVHHLGVVNQLVEAWRHQRNAPLPRDATEAVHREVLRAEDWGLVGRDVQVFVLVAVELRGGFERDHGLQQAARQTLSAPNTLADRIGALPPEFWERYRRAP